MNNWVKIITAVSAILTTLLQSLKLMKVKKDQKQREEEIIKNEELKEIIKQDTDQGNIDDLNKRLGWEGEPYEKNS